MPITYTYGYHPPSYYPANYWNPDYWPSTEVPAVVFNRGTERYREGRHACDKCGFMYPKTKLYKQRGYRVCHECFDAKEW